MTGAIDNEILSTKNFLQDAFGVGVIQNTRNKIDLPSTYDFNTERYLLYVNGSRANPGTTAFTNHLTDAPSRFDLEPDAGDTVELRVRERPRYVPGFEVLAGIAWYMGSTLPSNATVKVGLRDAGENGFFGEYSSSGVEAVIEKGGTKTVRQDMTDGYVSARSDQSIQEKLQQPQIDRHKLNMYGVGGFKPGKSYLNPVAQDVVSGVDNAVVQKNENMLGEHLRANDADVTDDVGVGNLSDVNTNEFNLHLSIEIDCSNASSGATLSALSMQYVVFGDVDPTTRPKPLTFENITGTNQANLSVSEGWNNAVIALRAPPDRDNIDVDLTILGLTPTVDMTMYAHAFDPEDIKTANSLSDSAFNDGFVPVKSQAGYGGGNTALEAHGLDGGWDYPRQSAGDGYTDPFGNADGNAPDNSRLLNRASETAGSSQGGGTAAAGEKTQTKRTIFNDDVVLLIPYGHTGVSGGDVDILDIATEQDW